MKYKQISFALILNMFSAILAFPQSTGIAQRIVLQSSLTATESTSGVEKYFSIKDVTELTVALKVTSADRTTGNETYDIYITTGIRLPDGTVTKWDIAHFPQVAATGAKTYVACIKGYGSPYSQTVTTAGPGVMAVNTATMKTDTAGSDQGTKTLTAGMVRHGVFGAFISYELVAAGTTPILAYQISAVAK